MSEKRLTRRKVLQYTGGSSIGTVGVVSAGTGEVNAEQSANEDDVQPDLQDLAFEFPKEPFNVTELKEWEDYQRLTAAPPTDTIEDASWNGDAAVGTTQDDESCNRSSCGNIEPYTGYVLNAVASGYGSATAAVGFCYDFYNPDSVGLVIDGEVPGSDGDGVWVEGHHGASAQEGIGLSDTDEESTELTDSSTPHQVDPDSAKAAVRLGALGLGFLSDSDAGIQNGVAILKADDGEFPDDPSEGQFLPGGSGAYTLYSDNFAPPLDVVVDYETGWGKDLYLEPETHYRFIQYFVAHASSTAATESNATLGFPEDYCTVPLCNFRPKISVTCASDY